MFYASTAIFDRRTSAILPWWILSGFGAWLNGFLLLVLLQKALDPPDPEVVGDALSLLVHVHALEKTSPRGRYEPTFYGRLLASFSLSFDASVLVLKFGEIGMLREGILLGILMDTQPLPILQPFGDENLVLLWTLQFTNAVSCLNNYPSLLISVCRVQMLLLWCR